MKKKVENKTEDSKTIDLSSSLFRISIATEQVLKAISSFEMSGYPNSFVKKKYAEIIYMLNGAAQNIESARLIICDADSISFLSRKFKLNTPTANELVNGKKNIHK